MDDLFGRLCRPFDAGRDLSYLIRMAGAPLSFGLSFYYGLLVIGLFFFLFPWRAAFLSPLRPLTVILVFAGGTMVLAALFRAGYPDAQFQTSRYLLYPQMVVGMLGFYGWRRLYPIRKLRWIRFLVPMLFALIYSGNYRFGEAGFMRTAFRAQTRRYWHPMPAKCATVCAESCGNGIYCIYENRDFTPRYYFVKPQYPVSPR